jgi:hypothetical protein
VTSGQFLIDSEARIREALAKMIKGDLAGSQKPSDVVAGQSDVKSLPVDIQAELGQVVAAYLAIGQKLVADSTDGIADPSRKIAAGIDAMLKSSIPGDPHFWHKHEEAATVRGKALEMIDAKSLDEVRVKYADLSVALAKLLRATGVPASFGKEVDELHCPMYHEGQGGSTWLQLEGTVQNPYFGTKMPGCFDRREALPVTSDSPATSQPATHPVTNEQARSAS